MQQRADAGITATIRVNIRWLPKPAYEDTITIALNIGGYFLELRVSKKDGLIQWSRAGARKVLSQQPLSYQWTPIIDSLNLTKPDYATWDWEKLGNGCAFEAGTSKCSHRNGVLAQYEEIWQRVTDKGPEDYLSSWILQSVDGTTLVGLGGATFLGMHKAFGLNHEGFGVRREQWNSEKRAWNATFVSGDVTAIPRVARFISLDMSKWCLGGDVVLGPSTYIVRGLERGSLANSDLIA